MDGGRPGKEREDEGIRRGDSRDKVEKEIQMSLITSSDVSILTPFS